MNKDNTGEWKNPLLEQLISYGESDCYPFHMPGHKRQVELGITSFPNPFSVDITEIDGFDNLHHAEEILRESMDRAAAVYGADRTYYMVNGSTGGILSAISGVTSPGGKIIMARNSHKAAYHAVLLGHLDPVYVYPDYADDYGIQGGIDPAAVEAAFENTDKKTDKMAGMPFGTGEDGNGIQAVFITSPTYEGMVSDIGAIAGIAHRHGVPLIVDEAHGAHFPFGAQFPCSALECGADIVIQSLHKTLPSLTQTAVMHIKDGFADRAGVERYLSVFQSSSPSYVFLASIENCIRYMDGEGRARMERYAASLQRLMECGRKFKHLRLADDGICGRFHIKDRDASKIVISTKECGMNGAEAADLLRSRFHLEPEMACGSYLILMTSLMDTEDGFRRLYEALCCLDELAGGGGSGTEEKENGTEEKENGGKTAETGQLGDGPARTWLAGIRKVMKISDAWGQKLKHIPLKDAAGTVSGGFITVYPPGVPMIVPGELISEEAVELIRKNREIGLTVEGIAEDGTIAVSDVIQMGNNTAGTAGI